MDSNALKTLARAVISTEAAAVASLDRRVDDTFVSACELLLACSGQIVVLGMGKSGHIASKIAATLASTGTPAFFVHPAEASHGDLGMITAADLQVVSKIQPTDQQMQDLLFAWKVAKFVKSNAIVYAANGQTVGVGAGQMSRINSARIAAIKAEHAGLQVKGSVMASDAFFPFRDGIDNAGQAGIAAVIQPGGSIRDEEVIAAADEHGMAMVFTGMRHFRH